MDAFTARNWPIEKAPRRLELLGDKTIRPEPAQHIIEFPGGAIEVSRTSDGCYWAHIIVNRSELVDDVSRGRLAALGQLVGSRVARDGSPILEVPDAERLTQIAVLIKPVRALA